MKSLETLEKRLDLLVRRLEDLERRLSVLERSVESLRTQNPPRMSRSGVESRYLSRIVSEARRDFKRRG